MINHSLSSEQLTRVFETDYPTPTALGVIQTVFGLICNWGNTSTLWNATCTNDTLDKLLAEIERHKVVNIKGHDEITKNLLRSRLSNWTQGGLIAMVHFEAPELEMNPNVTVETIDPNHLEESASFKHLFEEVGELEAWKNHCEFEKYRNGEVLVGWINGKPAARAGWFTVNGIARFRTVVTNLSARGQRVGTTLIRYIQDHPEVCRQDFLTIFSAPATQGGAQKLYERLGFRSVGTRWQMGKPK